MLRVELALGHAELRHPNLLLCGEPDICRDQQVCMTLRWREVDSNPRFPARGARVCQWMGQSPRPAFASAALSNIG